MESTKSPSPLDSFRSKKILRSPPSDRKPTTTDPSSETPEKPAGPPRGTRRRLMSIKEVREAALNLRSSGPKLDPAGPDRVGSGRVEAPARSLMKNKKKAGEAATDLPEKYEILCKFFHSLQCSLRLLRLKGQMSTLKKISAQIGSLTDRRFSDVHLAQLKFILPEVIELKKVLVYDDSTFCMKPDIHVALDINSVQNDVNQKNANGKPDLTNIFRARLLDFVKAHPEEEVPEGILPEPFNRSNIGLNISSKETSSSTLLHEISSGTNLPSPIAAASHLSQTFRKRFSKQASSQSIGESCTNTITKEKSLPCSHLPETPIKDVGTSTIKGTPAKVDSTSAKLMSATPAIQPPKRCYMTPDDDSSSSPAKLLKRPLRSRSLKFDTPVKNAKVEDELSSSGGLSLDDDIFDILPENLVLSIREKEMKLQEDRDPAISQAKRRQQMIASLPKLFDMIRYFFQSLKRSLITKEELLNKLVTTHLDIVDRKEIEEQLALLQELVPELLHEKLASSGDLLIGMNKGLSKDSICERLYN